MLFIFLESAGVHKYRYFITQNSSSHCNTRSIYSWRRRISHWQRISNISCLCHRKRTYTSTVSNVFKIIIGTISVALCSKIQLKMPSKHIQTFLFRYVFWYHNDRMVNYDSERGVSVTTIKGTTSSSSPGHPNMGSSSDSKDYDMAGNVNINQYHEILQMKEYD